MGLFTPVKKHANKFRYIPRYYDPEKERREQRRRELHGTSSEDDNTEYTPGQYIRTQREARRLAARNDNGGKKMPSMAILMILAIVVVIVYMLYPRIVHFHFFQYFHFVNREIFYRSKESKKSYCQTSSS